MCMFCAAIPAAAAVGVRLEARERACREKAAGNGEPLKGPRTIRWVTGIVVTFLLAASILVHTLTFDQ